MIDRASVEQRALDLVREAVRRGTPPGASLVIEGTAGIGKTFLARRILDSLPPGAARTIYLAGEPGRRHEPLAAARPLLEGLRDLLHAQLRVLARQRRDVTAARRGRRPGVGPAAGTVQVMLVQATAALARTDWPEPGTKLPAAADPLNPMLVAVRAVQVPRRSPHRAGSPT